MAGRTSSGRLCIGVSQPLACVHVCQYRDQSDYGKLVPVMGRLCGACVLTSGLSSVCLVVVSNTALALTSRNYCVVLFSVPFTSKVVQFPRWMFGPIPLSVWGISTLAAVVLWTVLLVRRSRGRSREENGITA